MSSEKVIKNLSTGPSSLGGSITKRQIVEARAEARRILAEAEKDAARIRAEAETSANEMREKAWQEGYETSLLEWNNLLLEAKERRDNALASVERDILRLSIKIAGKILGHELKRDKARVADIVATALRHARRNEMVRIRVNPADSPMVEAHRDKLDPTGRANFLDIVADPLVSAGGCIIESDSGAIDAQLETQLRILERALLTRTKDDGR